MLRYSTAAVSATWPPPCAGYTKLQSSYHFGDLCLRIILPLCAHFKYNHHNFTVLHAVELSRLLTNCNYLGVLLVRPQARDLLVRAQHRGSVLPRLSRRLAVNEYLTSHCCSSRLTFLPHHTHHTSTLPLIHDRYPYPPHTSAHRHWHFHTPHINCFQVLRSPYLVHHV